MDVYLFMLANNSDIITKEVHDWCTLLVVAMQCIIHVQ